MENPEEILHSLEEFAKMKPKDIPRELEEYLKFVAKTGDPIYQWSAIKSLFREKFINVITEFYESCTSMEIPPCPNVEMFNYDLMKNFIIEKLDTFASAPFTLQRICELLTSPRKEYTRIDKYMRALEKNILVVSTTEPGGRRTENGESIMNGIESDHEHVPEPGNVINVEEMDDSPYIQTTNHVTERISFEEIDKSSYIQTTNHVTEHISFDNPKNCTHIEIEIENTVDTSEKITSEASTSSQEIVCVQYVSIEPVAGNNTQNLSEETKETDVSVTITAVNVKDDNKVKPQIIEPDDQQTPTIAENVLDSTNVIAESVNKPNIEPESEVHMETEPVESNDEMPKIENTEISPHPISEAIPSSTTLPDKPSEESDQPQITSESENLPESGDGDNVSPENSITSSDNSSESISESHASVEVPSSNFCAELVETSIKGPTEILEDRTVDKKSDDLEKDNSDAVDSTTKSSGEDNIEGEVSKQIENEKNETKVPNEIPIEPDSRCGEETPKVHTVENENFDTSDTSEVSVKTDVPTDSISSEPSKPDETNESSEDPELKAEEPVEPKIEEVSSLSEEKEIPMEVDAVPENISDETTKQETPIKEPESSEPPENP